MATPQATMSSKQSQDGCVRRSMRFCARKVVRYRSQKQMMGKIRFWMAFTMLWTFADAIDWMPMSQDRTQIWWLEGPPKVFQSNPPPGREVLCFQYGAMLWQFDTKNVRPLQGQWKCSLESAGKRYQCVGCKEGADEFFQPVRFVEAGKWFHRVVIDPLRFVDDQGGDFPGSASLEISVWPDCLTIRFISEDADALHLEAFGQQMSGKGAILLRQESSNKVAKVESELPVEWDKNLACHRIRLPEKPWSNASGTYYPEEHLDRMDRWRLTLSNDSDRPVVARVMFTQEQHLPITGFTPMLCDAQGNPTGHLVQISKNWHKRPERGRLTHDGTWYHGCLWVRVPPHSKRDFFYQMVYARYADTFAASHAQLSLIGWGHNQFWDQVAVGSFGESICFEPGRVQRRCWITDVRPLLTMPQQKNAKAWGWAENAGGGDALMWIDESGRYQPMVGTRSEPQAHGPCLTDVVYQEQSRGGEISSQMQIMVPAAEDHLRTKMLLRYDVKKSMRWKRLAFFQLGADYYNDVPATKIAYGNREKMTDEWPTARVRDQYDRNAVSLTGADPWISIHGVNRDQLKAGRAAATRGIILRSWRAKLGGKAAGPSFSTYGNEWGAGNFRTAIELSPPAGLSELQPGDFIEAEIDLVVFPSVAAAYYGPDQDFAKILQRDADTYKLVQREAVRRRVTVEMKHGKLKDMNPLTVAVDHQQRAEFTISGGLGHVPVRVVGLTSADAHEMMINGKNVTQWQMDWDTVSQTWRIIVPVETGHQTSVIRLLSREGS